MFKTTGKIAAFGLVLFAMLPLAALAGGKENEVTFGSRWWWQSAPEARYREYTDLSRGGFVESFSMAQWNARDAFSLTGQNALLGDQSTRLALARGVQWQLDIKNSQLPHLISAIARTPYTQIAPGVFALPDSMQSIGQATAVASPANYTRLLRDLLATAPRVDNTIRTEVSSARLRGRPMQGWRFEVRGERRDRSGSKPYGAAFGFNNAIELIEPIHQRTIDGQVTASYQKSRVKAQASVGVSAFKNFISEMVWDNPKRLTDRFAASTYSAGNGAAQGRMDMYPDNQVVRSNLALGLNLPQRTTFSATIGFSQGTQDDAFLPYVNNSLAAERLLDSLPARSLNGKMTRTNMDFRLVSRAYENVRGTLRYNHTKADNKTPEYFFTGFGVLDGEFRREFKPGISVAHHNPVFGNENSILGIDVDIDAWNGLVLGVTGERREREHTHREVEKDDETVAAVRASYNVSDAIHVLASFRQGKRELDEFIAEDYYENGLVVDSLRLEHAALRRFDVADRDQDLGNLQMEWGVTSWLDLGAQYNYRVNDYPNSGYGLTREEDHLVMLEGTMRPTDRVELNGGYGYGRASAYQNSNETNTAPPPTSDAATNWRAATVDRNVYYFLDADWWAVKKKVALSAGYQINRTLGDFKLFGVNAVDLPSTFYRQTSTYLGARWAVMTGTELAGRWHFDELDVDDYLKENIPLVQTSGTTASSIWLGNSALSYRAHRIELMARKRF